MPSPEEKMSTPPDPSSTAGRQDEVALALWDRRLVETLAARQRAMRRWACRAAFSATPVAAEEMAARMRRLGVELAADDVDDDLIDGIADLLAADALDAVLDCLRSCEPEAPVAG